MPQTNLAPQQLFEMTKHFSAAAAAVLLQPLMQQGQLRDAGPHQGSLFPNLVLAPPTLTCFRSGNRVEQGNEIRVRWFNP